MPPPSPFTTHTREPSPVTEPTPRLSLRQPKFLSEYEKTTKQYQQEKSQKRNNTEYDSQRLTNSNMIDEGNKIIRGPSPLDKLSTYRRTRSLTQQQQQQQQEQERNFNDNNTMPVKKNIYNTNHGILPVEVNKSIEPVFMAKLPSEMTNYILEVEEQNRQLRQQVITFQEELNKQKENSKLGIYNQFDNSITDNKYMSHQDVINGLLVTSGVFETQEERERYMNDILNQIDIIVQAHRNQSESEILKYKEEAESAKLALKQLREAITLEGVDLSMLPAAIMTLSGSGTTFFNDNKNNNDILGIDGESGNNGKDYLKSISTKENNFNNTRTNFTGEESSSVSLGISTLITNKCTPLLNEAVEAVLVDLLHVEANDDVPAVVRRSVQRGFNTLTQHMSSLVTDYISHCTQELRYLHREREEMRREMREELNLSEQQRLRAGQRCGIEIRTLREALHALHKSAVAHGDGDGELAATVQAKAMGELINLLNESREAGAGLRRELEAAHQEFAARTLRLKSSLQRRAREVEAALTHRARELVGLRDNKIKELEKTLEEMQAREERRRAGRGTRGVQTEAAEEIVVDASHFISNVLSLGSTRHGAAGLNQSFATPSLSARHPSTTTTTIIGEREKEEGVKRNFMHLTQEAITPSMQGVVDPSLEQENSFEEEVWAKTMELLNKYGNPIKK